MEELMLRAAGMESGETDISGGNSDNDSRRRPRKEIGILADPESQRATIHGLTDLFVEAGRIAREMGAFLQRCSKATGNDYILDANVPTDPK